MRAPFTQLLTFCLGWLQELLLKLVEDYYPLPVDPDAAPDSAQKGPKAKKPGADAVRQVLHGPERVCVSTCAEPSVLRSVLACLLD